MTPTQSSPSPAESNPELLAEGARQTAQAMQQEGLNAGDVETITVEGTQRPEPMPQANEPVIVVEYTTNEELLANYAQLLVGQRQQTFAVVMCIIDVVLAAMVIVTWPQLWIISVVLVALAVWMLIWRKRAALTTAKRLFKNLDTAELHRVVSVYGDRIVLTKANGVSHDYPVTSLSDLKHNDVIAVLVFGDLGVTVPRSALSDGDWQKLLTWAQSHTPAGRQAVEQQEQAQEERAARNLKADETPTQSH